MRVQHPWRLAGIVIAAIVAAVIAAGVWLGVEAMRLDHSLSAAADEGTRLETFAKAGDIKATDAALAGLQSQTAKASSAADSPIWRLATHLPGFGDDARGVRTVADVTNTLSHGALPGLATSLNQLDELTPKNGRFDLTALEHLQQPIAQGRVALDQARRELAAQNPSGYIERLKLKYRQLTGDIDTAASALDSADKALHVLPQMLGADGSQQYLLVLQNNAEIRATGGLPGAISVLRADDGHISLVGEAAGSAFGKAAKPALPLTAEEKWLWGDKPGTYFLDANFSPDFPRAAALWRARWQQDTPPGLPSNVDGVLSIDPVTLSYILGAEGPVKVDGVTLTGANVVDQLLHQTYLRFPTNPAAQDLFFRDVATAVFAKVTNGGGSPEALLSALSRATSEHRVYVASFHSDVQHVIAGTPVQGAVSPAGADPQVGVTFNDGTGSKMSYYLRYNVTVDATSCMARRQGLSGEAHISSIAPPNAASLPPYITGGDVYGTQPGDQTVMVDLFAPAGGHVGGVEVNATIANAWLGIYKGHPVAQVWLRLKPGESDDLTWLMTTGKGQTGRPSVNVTPSVVSGSSSSMVPSACG